MSGSEMKSASETSSPRANEIEQTINHLKGQFDKQQEIFDRQTVEQNKKYLEVMNCMTSLETMMKTMMLSGSGHTRNVGGLYIPPHAQQQQQHQHQHQPQQQHQQPHMELGKFQNHNHSMKLDLPKFDGMDPSGWIFRIQEYFEFHGMPEDQRLRIVSFNMEEKASEWYQYMKTNKRLVSWEDFLIQVRLRFGLSDDLLKSMFISGLRQEIQRELLIARPLSLTETMSLARIFESRYDNIPGETRANPKWAARNQAVVGGPRIINEGQAISTVTRSQNAREFSAQPTQPNRPSIPIRRLSPTEMQEHRNQGLCYNCDQKWVLGHRCPNRFLILVGNTEDEGEEETEEEMSIEEEIAIQGDISSLNSFAGSRTPCSLRIWGKIGNQRINSLIDSGSTHNFVQPEVAQKLKLLLESTARFHVYIGNGDSMLCSYKCPNVEIEFQGLKFNIDLFVLPIQGPELVLGVPWLQSLGKITQDFSQMTMEFKWKGKKAIIQGIASLSPRKVTFNQLQAMAHKEDIHGIYELFVLDGPIDDTKKNDDSPIPPEVTSTITEVLPDALSREFEEEESRVIGVMLMLVSKPVASILEILLKENKEHPEMLKLHEQALYGRPPPTIPSYVHNSSRVQALEVKERRCCKN
ncbi:hypothetical protein C2S52_015541 [Perilla frutescens var. hirtella]|nr:hypothetical protein C2S52_015541 [Perilla frutescens var. hirtella]